MITALSNLFEVLAIIFCISYLYGKKPVFDIATVSVISIDLILMQTVTYYQLPLELTLLIYPAFIGYCAIEYRAGIQKLIVNTILFLIILLFLQYLIMLGYMTIVKPKHFLDAEALHINVILFVIVFCILRRCNLLRISNYLLDKGRLMIISIIVCFGIIFICLLINKQKYYFDVVSVLVILISTSLICALAANLGKYRLKAAETEAELKVHKLYEDSFISLIDNIRMKQHEFDNHINTIYSQHYIYKNYEQLVEVQKKYCVELEHENYYNNLLSTGNSIVIGFLYGKFIELEKQNIVFSYKVNIQELECKIPIYKLIEILNDLINNAMEAVKHTEREVFVSLIETDTSVLAQVENENPKISYEEMQHFFEKGYSRKGEGRGLGLYNVKRLCLEYDSAISCENITDNEKNYILFKIVIPQK